MATLASGPFKESWAELAARLDSYELVPEALTNAALLRAIQPRWAARVAASSWWLHGLRFVAPTAAEPLDEEVRVRWRDGVFEVTLLRHRPAVREEHGIRVGGTHVVAADRCTSQNIHPVLDSFLVQLVGGEPPEPVLNQSSAG